MPNEKRITLILRWNLALACAAGLFVLWSYLKEPSEPGSAVLFGFSYLRLILIGVVLFLLIGMLILLVGSFRNSPQAQKYQKRFEALIDQKTAFWIAILWMVASYVLLFLSDHQLGSLASYRGRLLPILVWLAVLSVQFSLILFYFRGMNVGALREYRSIWLPALVLVILFGLLLLVITFTRMGLTSDNVYWGGPGTPILLHQVFLAVLAAIVIHWLIESTQLGKSNKRDLVIFLGLWGLAFLMWMTQPARLTYFSLEPREPNFQVYPFSDALIYDSTAQEFLIGKPMPADLWVKPIYSLFLAFLHLVSGNNYALLMAFQVVILAIIPSFMYLLTTHLDQRQTGLVAAFFVIIRERNAMALSDVIQVSHSKLLLSDVFAMGEMILLVWLVMWWLQRPLERRAVPVAIGGLLGLLILTRGHPILIIPFLFLISFLLLRPNLKLWYESSLWITLGLSLLLVPWFWHTYRSTGQFTFQDPSSPYAVNDTLVKLYSQSSEAGPNAGSESSPSFEKFQSQAFLSLIEHPADVAYFTSAHYFRNGIFSFIYLPGSLRIEGLNSYVKGLTFWDQSWDGSMSSETWMLILFNAIVLALGLSTAWKKAGRLILAPLILGVAYNLSIAVARRSGWRFILPVDWVTLVFYAIGFVQFIVLIRLIVNPQSEQSESVDMRLPASPRPGSYRRSLVLFGLPFLLIAIGLVSGHRLFPSRYPVKTPQNLLQDYQTASQNISGIEIRELQDFLGQEGGTILHGKALYPIYFRAEDGMVNFNWPGFAPQPYSRLAFYLIGPQSMSVSLPMESAPEYFPDGASVIVIGCKTENGNINAISVLVQDDPPIHYNSGRISTSACPASGSD